MESFLESLGLLAPKVRCWQIYLNDKPYRKPYKDFRALHTDLRQDLKSNKIPMNVSIRVSSLFTRNFGKGKEEEEEEEGKAREILFAFSAFLWQLGINNLASATGRTRKRGRRKKHVRYFKAPRRFRRHRRD